MSLKIPWPNYLLMLSVLLSLILYPWFMRVDFKNVDIHVYSQISWFFPKLPYIVVIQCLLIVLILESYEKAVIYLPYVAAFIIVTGFIIVQTPNLIAGDPLLHGAQAKLIEYYGSIPPYLTTYVRQYPSSFLLSTIFSQLIGVEVAYSNQMLVGLLFIAVVPVLVALFKLAIKSKELSYLAVTWSIISNFYWLFFGSIFTPRTFALIPLYTFFYIVMLYFQRKTYIKQTIVISLLLSLAITLCHAYAPIYMFTSIIALLVLNFIVNSPERGLAIVFASLLSLTTSVWITHLAYISTLTLKSILKIILKVLIEGEPSLFHIQYGFSSSFIQSQFDFSKDFVTSTLRVYRLTLMFSTLIVGGLYALVKVSNILKSLRSIQTSTTSQRLCETVSLVVLFASALSFFTFLIAGRGHDYLLLYIYPLFALLAIMAFNSILKSSKISHHLVKMLSTIFVILIGITLIATHSSRIYLLEPEIKGLAYLARMDDSAILDISTTGDLFYSYAYFNPTYFWPGKVGRINLIFEDSGAIIKQFKVIPYVFQGNIVIRSHSQTFHIYQDLGLSLDFLARIDENLNSYRSRIFENGFFVLYF